MSISSTIDAKMYTIISYFSVFSVKLFLEKAILYGRAFGKGVSTKGCDEVLDEVAPN
jgi:hypothetical protein